MDIELIVLAIIGMFFGISVLNSRLGMNTILWGVRVLLAETILLTSAKTKHDWLKWRRGEPKSPNLSFSTYHVPLIAAVIRRSLRRQQPVPPLTVRCRFAGRGRKI